MGDSQNHRINGLSRRSKSTLVSAVGIVFVSFFAAADPPSTGVGSEEWAGIQQRIEAERHSITNSDRPGRLWQAGNPGQGFTTHFGDEDILLVPRGRGEPAWELGLQLAAWGAEYELQQVNPALVTHDGNRVEYRRGLLSEWYINTPEGLEQGFTIDGPPTGGVEDLVLEFSLVGELTTRLARDGMAVTFQPETASATVLCSGLTARDSEGTELELWMDLDAEGKRLRITVAVEGVDWPITATWNITQEVKLVPTIDQNTSSAHFGHSLAVDGDIMAVGVDDREFGELSGAVHIYQRDHGGAGSWGHVTKLVRTDAAWYDHFGYSVAVSGDTVIVGAPWGGDEGGSKRRSAAYVFRRDEGGANAWGQVAEIKPERGDGSFGKSVSISGDVAIVGSRSFAYVFYRGIDDAWDQVARLTATDPESYFSGCSVAVSGDTAIVGDHGSGAAYIFHRDEGGADAWGLVDRIVAGDSKSHGSFGRRVAVSGEVAIIRGGGVYIFYRGVDGTWDQVAKLSSPGGPVAISGDTAIVGDSRDSEKAEFYSGAARIYRRNQGGADAWGQVAKILAEDGDSYDYFGSSVAISGDTAVAGATGDEENGYSSGSVYVFQRDHGDANAWGQTVKHPCPPVLGASWDYFGYSVAVSGDTAVVGAYGDDEMGANSGAAYIFQRDHGGAGNWGRVAKLTLGEGNVRRQFGQVVAICGDTVIVGTIYAGAYIFQRNHGGPNAWGRVVKLDPVGVQGLAYFGHAVAISGDTAIVGAPGGYMPGAAYVFQRDEGGADLWGQVARLTPSEGEGYGLFEYFGDSVAISGDTAVVGKTKNPGVTTPAAYVFERNLGGANNWGEVTRLGVAPYSGGGPTFAESVGVSGDTAVVSDRAGGEHGLVYVYSRDEGGPNAWGQVTELAPEPSTSFRDPVAIDGDHVVVGAGGPVVFRGSAFVFRREQSGDSEVWVRAARRSSTIFSGIYDRFGASVAVSEGTAIIGAWGDAGLGEDSGSAFVYRIQATAPCTAPSSAPTVTAFPDSPSSIALSWILDADATGYKLYRDSTLIYEGPNGYHIDTELDPSTRYCYTAVAYNSCGNGPQSQSSCATTESCTAPPSAPAVTAVPASPTSIELSWMSDANATGYKLYRDSTLLYEGPARSYTDTGLSFSTRYCYTVVANNSCGIDGPQSQSSCATTDVCVAPSSASTIKLSGASQSRISMYWLEVADATGYKLYRDSTIIYDGPDRNYSDTGLTSDTQYCYTVVANNMCGDGPQSQSFCATTHPCTAPPSTPTLTAYSVSSSSVAVRWTKAADAKGYKLYRDSTLIYDGPGRFYTESGLDSDIEYCYTVLAYNNCGDGAPSQSSCATTGVSGPAKLSIASVARTRGELDSYWSTQLRMVNPEDHELPVLLRLVILDLDAVGLTRKFEIPLNLQPYRTYFYPDIVAEVAGAMENVKGALQIEVTGDVQGRPVITSRTSTRALEGSYGQFIPAEPMVNNGVSDLVLAGLADNSEYRTNIGVTNLADQLVTVDLAAIDPEGEEIGRAGIGVPGLANNQQSIRHLFPAFTDTVGFSVRVDTRGAAVTAYATTMHAVTSDPVFITTKPNLSKVQIVPNLAHIDGKYNSVWRSELGVHNPNLAGIGVHLTYFPDPGDGFDWQSKRITHQLEGHQTMLLSDVVNDFLNDGEEQSKGYLKMELVQDGELPPVVVGRTYTIDGEKIYGQGLQMINEHDLLGPGETAWIAGVEDSTDYRTNFSVLNVGDSQARIELRFVDENGIIRDGAKTLALPGPGEFSQFDLFDALPALEPGLMRGSLQIIVLEGTDLYPYVTIMDNFTNDPIFVPAARVSTN
ncbi:MAG: hypothetical protein GY906_08180 [bacterium]|nr:hypothetical protein [bacterium]